MEGCWRHFFLPLNVFDEINYINWWSLSVFAWWAVIGRGTWLDITVCCKSLTEYWCCQTTSGDVSWWSVVQRQITLHLPQRMSFKILFWHLQSKTTHSYMLYLNTTCWLILESVSYIALWDAFKQQVWHYTACSILEIYFDVVSKFVSEFMAQAATGEDICFVQPGWVDQSGWTSAPGERVHDKRGKFTLQIAPDDKSMGQWNMVTQAALLLTSDTLHCLLDWLQLCLAKQTSVPLGEKKEEKTSKHTTDSSGVTFLLCPHTVEKSPDCIKLSTLAVALLWALVDGNEIWLWLWSACWNI